MWSNRLSLSVSLGLVGLLISVFVLFFFADDGWMFGNWIYLMVPAFYFLVGFLVGRLVETRARAEYAWLFFGVILVDSLFLSSGYGSMYVFHGLGAFFFLFVKLGFLSFTYTWLFGFSESVSDLLMYLSWGVLLASFVGWAVLYIRFGALDELNWRVYLRRLLLVVVIVLFGLASYGCQFVPGVLE